MKKYNLKNGEVLTAETVEKLDELKRQVEDQQKRITEILKKYGRA